jgi:hypothetical protein
MHTFIKYFVLAGLVAAAAVYSFGRAFTERQVRQSRVITIIAGIVFFLLLLVWVTFGLHLGLWWR